MPVHSVEREGWVVRMVVASCLTEEEVMSEWEIRWWESRLFDMYAAES